MMAFLAATLGLGATAPPVSAKPGHHHHYRHHRQAAHPGLLKLRHAQVTPLSFAALNGWTQDDQSAAFKAFLKSCGAIRYATPAMRRKNAFYNGLYEVCQRALKAGALDRVAARRFFESNFSPVRIAPAGETEGFFTGYYEVQ
ncbi:MAG TPA: lytic transglycosylase, partial [Pseudolabrys sp.]|nr:lytic transglycosylase [Pseudolabrys sp.]